MSFPCEDGERRTENFATLRLAGGPLAAPVLCRVVSMVLARADCPMNRLDDALIVCDALSASAPAHSVDGRLDFTVSAYRGGVELRVGSLEQEGALGIVHDALVPGVGNVLERISDEVRVVPAGEGEPEQLVLALGF
ncbi:MAG TPA: hypothetical protein VID29_02015 [Solirubrobacteraceae bacterium]